MVLSLLEEEVMAASPNHEEVDNGAAEIVSALLIGLLMLAGSVCLYEGLGADLGMLGQGALKAYAIPAGAGLLVLALLTAMVSNFDRGEKSRSGASSPGPPPRTRLPPPVAGSIYEYRAPSIRIHDYAKVELPNPEQLRAAAAMLRCLLPARLRGHELKAIREIMKLSPVELSNRLSERVSPESVVRWESEEMPLDEELEKGVRLLACRQIQEQVPGIEFNPSMITHLRIAEPQSAEAGNEAAGAAPNSASSKEQAGAGHDKRAA
jgi:DNA-binding transcriptional regulator YiaG